MKLGGAGRRTSKKYISADCPHDKTHQAHNGGTKNTKKVKEDYDDDDLLEQSDPVFTKKKYVGKYSQREY